MKKMLTDMHTHSTFSHDGTNTLTEMLEAAYAMGVAFYGVSEHFDYDYDVSKTTKEEYDYTNLPNPDEYFHTARHLQEDYEGCMNVCVGAEFGYSDEEGVKKKYLETYEKYRPDFVINSVHSDNGLDFYFEMVEKPEKQTYSDYLALIRRSLDAPYPYDIVGHIEYVVRYVPFENKEIRVAEYQEQIDDILKTIIQKGKILELNSSTKQLPRCTLPSMEIVRRYYELGGRKISFGSDAHFKERILDKREKIVELVKEIGFTYMTVPFRGEYIKVEL